MSEASLRAELASARSWLTGWALPFWSTTGFDAAHGRFVERTGFDAAPITDVPHRLMVQCRQIYVFSHAALLGWWDGRKLVEQALASLERDFTGRVAGTPYVFSVARSGEVVDPRQDSYSYAFLIFALAWAGRLLGEDICRARAEALLEHMRAHLACPNGPGFIDGLPRPDEYLRQNPQMHMLEALLELRQSFGSATAPPLCRALVRLFRQRLFLAGERALPEQHDNQWHPVADMFEPGHHFEWIWLLDRHAALSGDRVDDLVAGLAARAWAEGIDASGAAVESVPIRAGAPATSRRCWGTCEALKAAASDYEHGRAPDRAMQRALLSLQALRTVFLGGPFPGGWTDRVDADGKPLLDYVPASTLYHVFLAVAEAHRVFA